MKWLLLLILLPAFGFGQTCIVAIKNKGVVYIGAESRVGYHGKYTLTQQEGGIFSDTTCKLVVGSKIGFAVSGYDGLRMKSLAMEILNDTISFESFRKNYQEKSIHILMDDMQYDMANFREYSNRMFVDKNILSSIIFFGINGDSVFLKRSTVVISRDPKLGGFITWYNNPQQDTLAAGEVTEIYKTKILFDKNVWKHGEVKGIEYLIGYSHNLYPDKVGGPINIVEVKKNEIKWIGKKPPCY
jgi:hypothetical protein